MENQANHMMSDTLNNHPVKTHHQCQVVLAGNLVAKPEIRYKANPVVPIAEFTLATHHSWFDKGSNQFKNWTTFHPMIMTGNEVDNELIHADKGQLLYITGRLRTKAKSDKDLVDVSHYHLFSHGSNQGFNTIHCTASVTSPLKVMQTENSRTLTEFSVVINQHFYSNVLERWIEHDISRLVHMWGKPGQNAAEKVQQGDLIMIEGSLSYQNDGRKSQLVEAKKIIK